MTEAAPEIETRTVNIQGRDIVIKRISDTQLIQLNHEAAVMQRDNLDPVRLRKGMDRVFRALTSTVVGEEDADFLQDLMADGDLDLRELIEFITSFHKDQAPANGPVKVRRGRPAK